MPDTPPVLGGLIGSLRDLGATAVGAVQERLELFALELHEEKLRLVQLLLWIAGTILAAVLALTFASLLIVFLCEGSARIIALVSLTAFYIAALVAAIVGFKRYLARMPRPFNGTLQELKQDRSCIQPEN